MMDMPEGLDCLRRRERSTEVCRGCLKVIACGGRNAVAADRARAATRGVDSAAA